MFSQKMKSLNDKLSGISYNVINYFFKNSFSDSGKNIIETWREKIFFSIFFSTIVIGIFSLFSSIRLVMKLHLNVNAWLYILIYLMLVTVTFMKSLSFQTKVLTGIASFYLLGFIGLVTIGPLSCGHIWLFAFSIASCLTNGFGFGILSVIINLATLSLIGILMKYSIIEWPYSVLYNYGQWQIINYTFIFITTVFVISLSMIVYNFERLLKKESGITRALLEINRQYETENKERKKTEEALKDSLQALHSTHEHLVRSEKMVAIGELISGVTHELNTPIGVGVTASSFLEQKTSEVVHIKKTRNLTEEEIGRYIRTAAETSSIIFENMNQVAGLIKSFDQLTLDQRNEEPRFFFLKEYIEELLVSIQIKTKKKKYDVQINCSEGIKLRSYPGAFSQIITHLIFNSVTHGFVNDDPGKITFDISVDNQMLNFRYYDNGCGMDYGDVKKIFNPFYTTKRNMGRAGLGMHIVYNIVTQLMNGEIACNSGPQKGMDVFIRVPIEAKK